MLHIFKPAAPAARAATLMCLAALFPLANGDALAGPFAYISNYGWNAQNSHIATIDTTVHATVGNPIPVLPNNIYISVVPSGHRLFATSLDTPPGSTTGKLSIIDARSGSTLATLALVGTGPIAVHPDENRVYVAHPAHDRLSVVDVVGVTVVAIIPSGPNPSGLVLSPDGRRLYVADSFNSGSISVYDTTNMTLVQRVAVLGFPKGIDITPDGRWVYTADEGANKVTVLDTQTNAVVARVDVGQWPKALAVSTDGTRAYVVNNASSTVSVIATASNSVLATVAVGQNPMGIAVTPDGRSVYVTNNGDATVSVIDATTLAVRTITGLTGAASVGRFIGPSPQAAALENPQPASFQSGIGLISGWACAGPIGVAIDGKPPLTVPQGSPRGDTYGECGNLSAKAGFGLLTNFNLLGAGTHTAQLWVGGAPLGAPVSFTVTPPAGEFLRGASKETTVADFPVAGKSTTLIWQEAQQNFAIKAVSP